MSGITQEWLDAHNARMASQGLRVEVPTIRNSQIVGSQAGKQKAAKANAAGVPNATEQRFHDEYALPLLLAGEILRPIFEPLIADLGDACTYRPDWLLPFKDGRFQLIEVKGTKRTKAGNQVAWYEPDAKVKIKWFRQRYPEIPLAVAFKTDEGWRLLWK